MRIIYRLIAGILALGLSGCIKTGANNPGNTGGSGSTLVKSYQVIVTDSILPNTSTQYTVTYSFDNSNRQSSATQVGTQIFEGVSSNMNYRFQFTYGQGTETETGTLQLGNIMSQATSVYNLNSSGYPDKLVTNSTSGTSSGTFTSIYQYDANGYCTEIDNSSIINNLPQTSTKTIYTISGGNIIQQDTYLAGGNLLSSTTFGFGTTSNKTVLRFSTPPVAGHLNNDLVESSQMSTLGVPKSALNYSYTFDSQGRVSTGKATTSNGKTYLEYSNIQYLQ
jgi:hypothetical protein